MTDDERASDERDGLVNPSHFFLSHNHRDKAVARRLGTQLKLVGADVWFDEWEVKAGDSLPGKVSEGLATANGVIVLWSGNADSSRWVTMEFETAIVRAIGDRRFRLIPVILDDTPLPPLLSARKWVDLRAQDDLDQAVNDIMGFRNDRDRLRAVQETLDLAGLEAQFFYGYGPVVCCPRCGGDVAGIHSWSQVDDRRDATYAGIMCDECGFTDGGEV